MATNKQDEEYEELARQAAERQQREEPDQLIKGHAHPDGDLDQERVAHLRHVLATEGEEKARAFAGRESRGELHEARKEHERARARNVSAWKRENARAMDDEERAQREKAAEDRARARAVDDRARTAEIQRSRDQERARQRDAERVKQRTSDLDHHVEADRARRAEAGRTVQDDRHQGPRKPSSTHSVSETMGQHREQGGQRQQPAQKERAEREPSASERMFREAERAAERDRQQALEGLSR